MFLLVSCETRLYCQLFPIGWRIVNADFSITPHTPRGSVGHKYYFALLANPIPDWDLKCKCKAVGSPGRFPSFPSVSSGRSLGGPNIPLMRCTLRNSALTCQVWRLSPSYWMSNLRCPGLTGACCFGARARVNEEMHSLQLFTKYMSSSPVRGRHYRSTICQISIDCPPRTISAKATYAAHCNPYNSQACFST